MHPLADRLALPVGALPWANLGCWPTPITRLVVGGRELWLKREDLAHPVYGGNKVRTLEVLLGDARARGVTRVWAAGAFGSNHAVATLVHAPRAGLRAGALLFPQPVSAPALENLRAVASMNAPIHALPSVALLPVAMARVWRSERRHGHRPWMMPPGGASPLGALGALSAVLELAEQLAAQLAPPPVAIVVAAGSACTSAGLLAGLELARSIGAWPWPLPTLHAVRVTPWPVTARLRIAHLAARALALLGRVPGAPRGAGAVSAAALASRLVVDGRELGGGYGQRTTAGDLAERAFAAAGGPPLDCVYTAKAAARLLAMAPSAGPLLFWSTKSSASPPTGPARSLPEVMRRFLAHAAP